jgi:hypothetical protein
MRTYAQTIQIIRELFRQNINVYPESYPITDKDTCLKQAESVARGYWDTRNDDEIEADQRNKITADDYIAWCQSEFSDWFTEQEPEQTNSEFSDAIPSFYTCENEGEINEIMISLLAPEGGTYGEFGIRWIKIGLIESPQLQVFDDAWKVLATQTKLLKRLASIDGKDISIDEMIEILLDLGYHDDRMKEHKKPEQTNSFTPGPWRLGNSHGIVIADTPVNEGGTGHDDTDYYGGYLIAESIAKVSDAKLIAAAPELLEALQGMVAFYRTIEEDNSLIDLADRDRYEKAIKAIKKATAN